MIVTSSFSKNTEKTISSIFRLVVRKDLRDLCISLTFLRRLSKLNRLNGKRRGEQRSKNKRQQEERKVAFFTQLFLDTPYMECLLTMESQVQTSSPRSFRFLKRWRQKRRRSPLQPPYWNTRRPWGPGKYNNFF